LDEARYNLQALSCENGQSADAETGLEKAFLTLSKMGW
jgi:hypothetical protein